MTRKQRKAFYIFITILILITFGLALFAERADIARGALQTTVNAASPGSAVHVRPGVYNERITIGKSLTLICDGVCETRGFKIAADNVTLDGFYILNSTSTEGGIEIKSNNNTVINNKIEAATMAGILVQGNNNLVENNKIIRSLPRGTSSYLDGDGIRFFGDKNIIRGNHIYGLNPKDGNDTSHNDCFQTWKDSRRGVSTNTLIENNYCDMVYSQTNLYDYSPQQMKGGDFRSPTGLVIRNNVIIAPIGFFFYDNASVTVENNTLVGYLNPANIDKYPSKAMALYSSNSNIVYKNNIVYNVWKYIVRTGGSVSGSGNFTYRSDGKSIRVDSAYDRSKDFIGVNPLFVNAGNKDFRLQANSPAIGAGAVLEEPSTPVPPTPTDTPAPALISVCIRLDFSDKWAVIVIDCPER